MKVTHNVITAVFFLCFFVFCVNSFSFGRNTCKNWRLNRYGDKVCMDGYPKTAHRFCPLMPRFEPDCERIRKRTKVSLKKCTKDSHCKGNSKCCLDICPGIGFVCTPADFMSYFVPV